MSIINKEKQHETEIKVKKQYVERTLSHKLDQFELCKIDSVRKEQLANGNPILCKEHKPWWSQSEIVKQEILERVLDFEITRHHPDGTPETWNIQEL